MMAGSATPPAVDGNAALRFLQLLGLDPATVWLRSIAPNRGANRRRWDPSRKGWAPDQHGLDLAELIADCAAGTSVYLITGTALVATGINLQGQLTGCVRDEDIISCRAFFAEWDKRAIADQLIAWRTLGLPEPTVMVLTGGKSVHVYWALDQAIDPATWRAITARLIAYCKSDPQCSNPSRLMRLPGSIYHCKKTGRPTGQSTIIHESGNRYSLAEFEAALAAGEQSQALELELAQPALPTGIPLAPIAPRLQEFPPRPLEQIRDALSYIPRRIGGGDETYGNYRNILWGLIQACAEASHGPEVAISLMDAHSPSKACHWDIRQVARSGGQRISAETFWWHARRHGWRPPGGGSSGGSGPGQPKPSQPTPPQDNSAAEGPRAGGDISTGIDTSLDMQRKPKRRTLAPDEVVQQLPQRLHGTPRLNIRTNDFEAGGKSYTADDVGRIYVHLSDKAERWPKELTADVFIELSKDRAFDPVEEELNRIGKTVEPLPIEQWERLDRHLLGIDDPIAAQFLPQFLLSAVARVFRPGCSVRRSPVLIGPQWRGKTRLGRILFGQGHWVENITDLGKDDLLRLQSAWGCELSELDGITRRKDQEALKAFLTATDDVFRAPYGKGVARYQRRCVFWGTANGPPLRDLSGSSRFVCIPLPDCMLPLDWAIEHRDAIWSRAVALYRQVPAGQEPWDQSTEEQRSAIRDRNSNHQETDPWADEITRILKSATDRPVSLPYVLDRMEIPKSQRNNAMAARVRQLAEAIGWVMERRRPAGGGEKKQGLWPAQPLDAITGHAGHTEGTPGGAQANPSQGLAFDDPGHTGHPNSTKPSESEIGVEAAAQQEGFPSFGVPAPPRSPEPPPALRSERAQRPDFGVPREPSRGAQPEPRRVRARIGAGLAPGIYVVTAELGPGRVELQGPEGSAIPNTAFRVSTHCVIPLEDSP